MITKENLSEARFAITMEWGDAGGNVVKACEESKPFGGTFKKFLDNCTACGGNWGGMLLSGIKARFPKVYDAIPDKMGSKAFIMLCYTLQLLGVDTSGE